MNYTPPPFSGGTVGDLTVSGTLAHAGASLGLLGAAPSVVPAAYTQPGGASRVLTAATAVAPAYTGGIAGYGDSAKAQAVLDALTASIADVAVIRNVLNQLLDDLQARKLIS